MRYGRVVMYHGVGEERLLRREGGGFLLDKEITQSSLADLPYMYSKSKKYN